MAIGDFVRNVLLLRRSVVALEAIAQQQRAHTALLERIADVIAPRPPLPATDEELRSTGALYAQDRAMADLQDYADKFQRDHGRPATEEELAAFLDER